VQQGIQLGHYNSQEVVRDIAELQDKLGIERWVLLGKSYGTRPAMMFMRDYPERVEAAVLAGAFPPWVGRSEGRFRHMDRVFDTIEKSCEADTDCARKYPNIKNALLSAMKAARDNPPALKVFSSVPMKSKTAYARIDDAEIVRWLAFHLGRRGGIKTAPKIIKALSEGRYLSLSHVVANWPLYEEPYFTQGAHWSIWCNDAPELQAGLLRKQARSLPYMADIIQQEIDHDICDVWPHTSDFALSTRPTDYAAEVPTLILTGDFDIPTPKEWAEEAERILPQSQLFNVPAAGHGYTVYICVQQAIDTFLKDTGRMPDVPCMKNENRLVFY
jgi:pimeloyl-ACP methyl ester carboxylesterase